MILSFQSSKMEKCMVAGSSPLGACRSNTRRALSLSFKGPIPIPISIPMNYKKAKAKAVSYTRPPLLLIFCSQGGPPRSPDISSNVRIRSEVIAPFRSVRMFFYIAFIGSASIGTLTSLPRLIASLGHAPNADPVIEVAKGLAIDVVAIGCFAFLYIRESKARERQIAKLSREESLANLKLELSSSNISSSSSKKIMTVGQMRGIFRLVMIVGPASYVEEAYQKSEPFISGLIERGVVVVPFVTDGMDPNLNLPIFQKDSIKPPDAAAQAAKLWRAIPIYTSEWARWLKVQKELADVSEDKPVYISLRLDGRVRGSGVGCPSWETLVAQLPPLKGMWGGALDGMDGKI